MSQNYSKFADGSASDGLDVKKPKFNLWMLLIFPAWVTVSFFVSQIVVSGLIWCLEAANVPFRSFNQAVLGTSITALVYAMTLFLVIMLPWLVKKIRTTWSEIGITRLPKWTDIIMMPAGLIIYLIFSSLLIIMATQVFPWFNVNQAQDIGFRQLGQTYEYILAFATLVVFVPIVEEILFRGYLYGKLKKFVPIWVAILATSILFGAIHGAWNLAFDTFALSIVLCLVREFTDDSIWASILLHMAKNGIAFYILFIYPSLLTTLVK